MSECFRLFVASVGLPGRLIRWISKLNLKFFNSLTRFYSSFLFGYPCFLSPSFEILQLQEVLVRQRPLEVLLYLLSVGYWLPSKA